MAATDQTLHRGNFSWRPTPAGIARFLTALLASLALYVATGFLLLGFFIGTLAGGTGPGEWSDKGVDIFFTTLGFHALVVVAASAWFARMLRAPVLPVVLSTAAILASPWVVSAITDSGSREMPDPSTKPGEHVERTPPASGYWTIEEAQRFDGYALFWVGPEYGGLAVSEIRRLKHSPGVAGVNEYVMFSYGTCKPPRGRGCSPPLRITLVPFCEEDHRHARATTTPLRGGAEMSVKDLGTVYVWTADASVEIGARSPQEVARALVALNRPSPATASDPLPAIIDDC